MKILDNLKGYDVYFDDGYYGIVKHGKPKPFCAYKYLWVVLKQKNL